MAAERIACAARGRVVVWHQRDECACCEQFCSCGLVTGTVLLVTFLPLPLLSVPFFLRRIADSTRLLAALPYFLPPDFFRAAIIDCLHESGVVLASRQRVRRKR